LCDFTIIKKKEDGKFGEVECDYLADTILFFENETPNITFCNNKC
jgi:hypothetical protein